MKRQLLATVTAACLLYGTTRPAHALFGVGDIVFDPSTFAEVASSAKSGLEELKWLGDLYDDAEKNIQILTNFYQLFAHVTDATQLAQVLNTEFIKSPLLTDALQLEQAFNGLGLHTTLAAKILGLVKRLQYYTPSNKDFAGFHLNQSVTATAGQMTTAQDAFAAETARITGLQDLMHGIDSPDPKRVQDIAARATIEGAQAVAQSNRLSALGLIQRAHTEAMQQQRQQAYRYSVDNLATQSAAAATAAQGGAVTLITQ